MLWKNVIENSVPEANFNLILVKRAGNWALLQVVLVSPFLTWEARLIMQQTDQGWMGQTMGTAWEDWEKRLSKLFY